MSPETYLRSDHVVGDNLQTSSTPWYGHAAAGHTRTNTIGVYHVSLKQQQQLPKNEHCSSDMFVSRRSKCGHKLKNLTLNQFLFLITILQVHEVLAETDFLGTTTTKGITTVNGTTCKERWTCSSCTEVTMPACSWSVAEQMCVDNTAVAVQSRMVVTNGSSCPKFSVENSVRIAVADNNMMTVTVKVNDADIGGGLIRLLSNSIVECRLDNNNYTAKVDGDRISCLGGSTRIPQYNTRCQQLIPLNHLLIVFDDKLLRFDNVSDHYVAAYPRAIDCPNIDCSHCHWNNGTHRFYCSLCLMNNSTSKDIKPYQYCDVRNISNLVHLSTNNILNRCSDKGPVVINNSVTPKIILQSDQLPGLGCSHVGNNSSPVKPTVDDGQVFGGTMSGVTTFRVKGQHFCGLQNVSCCVRNKYLCSACNVHNDTLMVCRSPKLDIHPNIASKTEPLQFYVKNSVGKLKKLELPAFSYRHYQDPVFTDFVFDGCCNVIVNGLYLNQGFTTEDFSITVVAENSSSSCQIISMDNTQIICKVSQSSSPQLGLLPKQINVMIGDNLNVVKPSKQKFSHFKSSFASTLLPGVVTIGAYVSFITVLCVALIFFKSSKNYDLLNLYGRQQLAEMRPLDERNPNDCDDNGEPENMLLVRDERH